LLYEAREIGGLGVQVVEDKGKIGVLSGEVLRRTEMSPGAADTNVWATGAAVSAW